MTGIGAPSGTTSYRWYQNGVSGQISQQQNLSVSPTQTTNYRLIVIVDGCWSYVSAWATVTVNQPPAPPNVTAPQTLCQREGDFALTATPTGGTWSGTGITGTNFNTNTAGPGVHNLTYDYTDANGCSSSKSTTLSVEAAPVASPSGTTTTVSYTHLTLPTTPYV